MRLRPLLLAAITTATLAASAAFAGPYRDAEVRMASAYADYRSALYLTNQKKQAETDAALASFKTKWTAIAADWKANPPPQYADDARLGETLARVGALADEAAKLSATGDLAQSHEVLEGIRDALGEMRARNGVVIFSDHMNAYHALMERVAGHKYAATQDLADDTAVLAHLAAEVSKNRPGNVDTVQFDVGFKAMEASVDALRKAVRAGDESAVAAARKGLKAPYSRLFQKFG